LVFLGDSENGAKELRNILNDNQIDPGIACLALETAQQIGSAPSPPEGMKIAVQMLRQTADNAKGQAASP
jgi:hypothetical protein